MSAPKDRLRRLLRSARNSLHDYNDCERRVREATSNDPWPCTSSQMNRIANDTNNRDTYDSLMTMLLRRLQHVSQIMHVKKGLLLVEFLLRNGNRRFVMDMRTRKHIFQSLANYRYLVEGVDKGSDVRAKATRIMGLLDNDDLLTKEREASHRTRQRLNGFGQTQNNYERDDSLSLTPSRGEQRRRIATNSSRPRLPMQQIDTAPTGGLRSRVRVVPKPAVAMKDSSSDSSDTTDSSSPESNSSDGSVSPVERKVNRRVQSPPKQSTRQDRAPLDLLTGSAPIAPTSKENNGSADWIFDMVATAPQSKDMTPALMDQPIKGMLLTAPSPQHQQLMFYQSMENASAMQQQQLQLQHQQLQLQHQTYPMIGAAPFQENALVPYSFQ